MYKINQTLSVGDRARLAVFCIFISTLSFPGAQGLGQGGRGNLLQTLFKGIVLCMPLIVLPINRCFKGDQLKNNVLLLFWGMYGISTSLWSPAPSYSLIRSISFIILILGVVAIFSAYIEAYEDFSSRMFVDLLIILSCITIFFAIFGILNVDIVWRKIYLANSIRNRLGGDILPPNTLGAVAALHLILAFTVTYKKNIFYFISILSSLYALIESNSRSAIIALIASGTISYVVLSFTINSLKRISFVFFTLAILAGSLFFVDSNAIKTKLISLSRYNSYEEIKTFTGRTYIWDEIFSQPKLTMLSGNGFGVISEKGNVIVHSINTVNAHNGYFQIIAGTGILGFSLFLAYVVKMVGCLIKLYQNGPFNNQDHRLISTIFFIQLFIFINNFAESSFGSHVVPQLITFLFSAMVLINSNPQKK